ncbi:uncharacterized protein LOC143674935 isoform X1 [Tamandua tetradactyla]|uniref:uncharacterized protein LOC143674935 isoform X1 n=1 Tax=Tamandua tetradactyla TaxID=48850 RepID=UPI004053ADEF
MPPTRQLGRGEFHNHSGREQRRGAKNPGSGNFGQRMRAGGAPSQTHTHFSPGLGKSPKAAPSAGSQILPTEDRPSPSPPRPPSCYCYSHQPLLYKGSPPIPSGACWNGLQAPASWDAKLDQEAPSHTLQTRAPAPGCHAALTWDEVTPPGVPSVAPRTRYKVRPKPAS